MYPAGDKAPIGTEDCNQRNFAQLEQLGNKKRETPDKTSEPAENPIITPHGSDEDRKKNSR